MQGLSVSVQTERMYFMLLSQVLNFNANEHGFWSLRLNKKNLQTEKTYYSIKAAAKWESELLALKKLSL